MRKIINGSLNIPYFVPYYVPMSGGPWEKNFFACENNYLNGFTRTP